MTAKQRKDYDVSAWSAERIWCDAFDISEEVWGEEALEPGERKPDIPSYARMFVCSRCGVRAYEILAVFGKLWFVESKCVYCGDTSSWESSEPPFGLILHSHDGAEDELVAPVVTGGNLLWHRHILEGTSSSFLYAPYKTLHQAIRASREQNFKLVVMLGELIFRNRISNNPRRGRFDVL